MKSRIQVKLNEPDKQRLQQGLTTFASEDEAQIWYVPMRAHDGALRVLGVQMDQSRNQHAQQMTRGAYALIQSVLSSYPESQWPQQIERLQPHFGDAFPIRMRSINALHLSAEQQARLSTGQTINTRPDKGIEVFYKTLGNNTGKHHQVLQLGPIIDPWPVRNWVSIIYTTLALILGLLIAFWVRPLWRQTHELRRVTTAFGQGDFTTRSDLPKRSILSDVSKTFNQMAERIQRLIESHQHLTNAVSHELRTPLSRLHFATDMLEKSDSAEERQRYIESIRQDVHELDTLVTELLDYARMERKGITQAKPHALLPWLQKRCEKQHTQPNITIELTSTGENSPTEDTSCFDDRLMARALDNLLANAQRYARKKVSVSYRVNETNAWISVDDDGDGIPVDKRETVFESFTRLDRSRDRETGGYGLGLAIVRSIIETHGGSIEALDSPLGGARLQLQWPRHLPAQ